MSDIDELFAGGGAAKPRTGRILTVIGLGLLLTLLGMACSAVPGGLVVLFGWSMSQKELDRVDSGYLPVENRPALLRLHMVAWACLLLVIACFIVQGVLLWAGVYTQLWVTAIELLRPLAMPAGSA